MNGPKYWPYYCEENIWHLCSDPALPPGRRTVAFVTNERQQVCVWQQRAARSPGEPVVWDYHVVLLIGTGPQARVWDLDCVLGLDQPLGDYLAAAFLPVPDRYAPRFRLIDAPRYVRDFGSDRRHMMEDGVFRTQAPPWPAIGTQHVLPRLLELDDPWMGVVVELDRLRRFGPVADRDGQSD